MKEFVKFFIFVFACVCVTGVLTVGICWLGSLDTPTPSPDSLEEEVERLQLQVVSLSSQVADLTQQVDKHRELIYLLSYENELLGKLIEGGK